MNPFKEKGQPVESLIKDWKALYPKAYDKNEVDPYTKTRIILMNGTEFEANWFSHQFARHVTDNDLKRDLALCRNIEKQQQLKISLLKPENESVLEHTIGYEQLAVDLTAELAKREKDKNVKNALDFALLEDFDHLYRYADLLEMDQGVLAERLVGCYTEIMPGRPTIAHHRFPTDNVRRHINAKKADVSTVLATLIITAAEQQTMNYYMNVTTFGQNDLARKLYEEIAMVEEEHVTQYESLIDPSATWMEMMLWHEYAECYLYWSCYQTETNDCIRKLWGENFEIEVSHLHKAAELLKKYEKKDYEEVIPNGDFPEPLSLHENKDYVRKILKNTVQYTSCGENYYNLSELPEDCKFFSHQDNINKSGKGVASHTVIEEYIETNGADYRYQEGDHPIPELADRHKDNIKVGRVKNATEEVPFFENN